MNNSLGGISFTSLKANLDLLGKDKTEIRKLTTVKIALIVTSRDLPTIVKEIVTYFNGFELKEIDDRNVMISGFHITIKLRKDQRKKPKPGLDNEAMFVSYINDAIKDNGAPLTLKFHGEGKEWLVEDVTAVKYVGNKNVFAGNKADAILVTFQNKKIPISLKKDNASKWASPDKTMKPTAEKFFQEMIDRKLTSISELPQKKNVFKINPIGFELDERNAKEMIFGNDVLVGDGAVIIRSFQPSDFDLNDQKEILNIKCSFIFRKYSDLTQKHKAYLILSNDSTRKVASNILPAGIRPEVVSGGTRLYGVKLVTYHAA